jgi:hypothetical protein
VFPPFFWASSFLLPDARIYSVDCPDTLALCGFELRCALHSSALVDGLFRLPFGSAPTVEAHFSIGLTGHYHRHSGAIRPAARRYGRKQDIVRPFVDGLHRSDLPPKKWTG